MLARNLTQDGVSRVARSRLKVPAWFHCDFGSGERDTQTPRELFRQVQLPGRFRAQSVIDAVS